MAKCSPVEMRKNLEIVNALSSAGMDFVAIPVIDNEHKQQLLSFMESTLKTLELKAKLEEVNS